MGFTGTLVWLALDRWEWLVPVMIVHGFTIVTMFAPMHECVHKTAFKSPWLNNVFGWIAGALCFYNLNYYRRYHTWHHRYTQDDELDPELSTPKPRSFADYAMHISGIPFWFAKPRELVALSLGRTEQYAFISPQSKAIVAWSARRSSGCTWRSWASRSPRIRHWRCGTGFCRPCWRSRCCARF